MTRTLLCSLALVGSSACAGGQTLHAIWNTGSGSYGSPANWDIGAVPINVSTVHFTVEVPPSPGTVTTITYDDGLGLGEIDELSLGHSRRLLVTGAAPGVGLTVLGQGEFENSLLSVQNAGFSVLGPATFTASGLLESTTLMSADGASAVLSLPQLAAIDDSFIRNQFSGARVHTIQAVNNGMVDLSGVQMVTGPGGSEPNRLDIGVTTGGQIDLSSLSTVAGSGQGRTRFVAVGTASMTLPSLANVSRAEFTVHTGGMLSDLGSSAWVYSAAGLNGANLTIMSADGAGSMLDLGTLVSIDDGFVRNQFSGARAHTIQAINDGIVNLSGVETIVGPGGSEPNRLDIALASGGQLDLSSLATISGSGQGRTRFLIVGPSSMTLPALADVSRSEFNVTSGGELTDSGSAPWTYSAAGLNGDNFTLMSADGAGSRLDLASLESIDDGFVRNQFFGSRTHTIQAINDGVVDLSGLRAITGPGGSEPNRLDIAVASGGHIDLSSLETVSGSAQGRTRFLVAGPSTLTLPALVGTGRTEFDVSGGGMISDDGSAPWAYSAAGLNGHNFTLMSADGPGSLLDFRNLETIDDGFVRNQFSGPRTHVIQALNGGIVDLSNVHSVVGPGGSEPNSLDIASTGGLIDLSSVTAITGAGNAQVRFGVTEGGEVLVGDVDLIAPMTTISLNDGIFRAGGIAATNRAAISLNNELDLLDIAGDLVVCPLVTVVAPQGGTVQIGGQLTNAHVDEANLTLRQSSLHFDGAGSAEDPQLVEVGGLDVGTAIQVLSNDNFGFGEVTVGQAAQPTVVELIDLTDNGNRAAGPREAMYFFGDDVDDSLRILGGSTLVIEHFNVYVKSQGALVNLQDLFGPGEDTIPFDEGFITTASARCYADCDLNGVLDIFDFICFQDAFVKVTPYGDCNGDCMMDIFDFLCFQDAFSLGCP